MDLENPRGRLSIVISEDKIMESILAIANYYVSKNTPSQIGVEDIKQIHINSKYDFDGFIRHVLTFILTQNICR